MRHGKKFNHLSRKKAHRSAMLSNMASSLILHKRIFTTTAKAKALRVYVEPLITKSKSDSTHNRRVVFRYLKDKESVKELFSIVAEKIADRPGGYTRVLKTHNRLGDNAEMCMIELVDFNDLLLEAKEASKKSGKTTKKRSRRGSGKKKTESGATDKVEAKVENKKVDATPDKLTKVEGIGPKIAEKLNDAGINSFKELAAKSADEIKSILEAAEGNFAAHNPETWPKQADMAANGKWDELKKWQDELDGGKA